VSVICDSPNEKSVELSGLPFPNGRECTVPNRPLFMQA